MTTTQLFKWFCKEQKITHIIHKMYHEIHPCKNVFGNGQIIRRYLTFDEYVKEKVSTYGFSYLLSRIVMEYMDKIRRTMNCNDYWDFRDKFESDFNSYCRRWEYFTKRNIFISENSVKNGDNIKFNNWGNINRMTVSSLNIPEGRIYGVRKTDDNREMYYCARFEELLNEDETPKEINYIIKRNRKTYNGKN